jgi:hypothetical protein
MDSSAVDMLVLLSKDLERDVRPLVRGKPRGFYIPSLEEACSLHCHMEATTPGTGIDRVPLYTQGTAARQRMSTVSILIEPHHRPTILIGFGWHEIHSSERRKPSEVSASRDSFVTQRRTVTLRI